MLFNFVVAVAVLHSLLAFFVRVVFINYDLGLGGSMGGQLLFCLPMRVLPCKASIQLRYASGGYKCRSLFLKKMANFEQIYHTILL